MSEHINIHDLHRKKNCLKMILEYVLRNKIKKNNKNNNKTKVLGNKMRKIQRSRNSQQN